MYSKHIIVILSYLAVCVLGRPSDTPPEKQQPTVIPIVSQSDEVEPNGTYKFSYETGNGIKREEIAYEKVLPKSRAASSNEGGEDDDDDSNEIHVQQGSYSYTAPDGTVITVRYIADENGFQPIGDHIHRSPVVPPSSSSAEKSGRSLKTVDSTESASAPVKAEVTDKPTEVQSPANVASTPSDKKEEAPLSPSTETTQPSTGTTQASTGTTQSSTETSETTTANVDVSTEAASTAAFAQPSTESEQASTASAEPASTSEPNAASTEDPESLSSTSAPEQSSSTEGLGQSSTSEPSSQTPAEETEQPSTQASQPASGEESSTTTTSA